MNLTLTSKVQLFNDVTTFTLQPESQVEWKAGQYFHYILNHENPDDRGTERWFTISSAPFEKNLSITTRFAKEKGSSFKNALRDMNIGDQIEGDGPEGDFVVEDLSKKYVFIAGGIGITPFRSILAQINNENMQIKCDLLYANKTEEYVFESELNQIAVSQNDFRIHKFTGDRLILEEDIVKISPNLNESIYYVSGPKPMVFHYRDYLTSIGVLESNIMLDDFPGYEGI